MANAVVGMDPTNTLTSAQASASGKGFGLGDRVAQHDGKEFEYVQAAAAIAANDVVFWVPGVFLATTLSTANDARGNNVGVAPVAVASGEFFWAQRKGNISANVLASAAANVRLNTTATAGKLDDDGTASSMQVQGIYLTTANGGSTAAVNAILNDPYVDVTL